MPRNVLLVLSDHDGVSRLVQHAAQEVFKAGDRFQLLWVTNHAELLKDAVKAGEAEPMLVGQDADKSHAVMETSAEKDLQKAVADKFGPSLDALQIPYQVHVLPTNALHLAGHVVQFAGAESAAVVVLPKAASAWNTSYINQHFPGPVVLA